MLIKQSRQCDADLSLDIIDEVAISKNVINCLIIAVSLKESGDRRRSSEFNISLNIDVCLPFLIWDAKNKLENECESNKHISKRMSTEDDRIQKLSVSIIAISTNFGKIFLKIALSEQKYEENSLICKLAME